MTYDKIEGEAKASDAAEAYFKKLADSWYAGWSHKGRTGFMQSLRIAYEMGGMDALSALGTRPEARGKDYALLMNVASRIRNSFEYNPGHSDLDNEQPIHLRVTLREWRELNYVLNALQREPQSGEQSKEKS